MMMFGKQTVLSESIKRDIFLLPGVALVACVLLADSCSSRKSTTPAAESAFSATKAVVVQEVAKSPAVAVAEAPTGGSTESLAAGEQTVPPH